MIYRQALNKPTKSLLASVLLSSVLSYLVSVLFAAAAMWAGWNLSVAEYFGSAMPPIEYAEAIGAVVILRVIAGTFHLADVAADKLNG